MNADWTNSPGARRVLVHWADPRPAWLWSADGSTLLWRNRAAKYFAAKVKKSGVRLQPLAVPIKGQISRLIRLGSPGRSSLSRIQFLAGEKPISSTCSCTPLELPDGHTGMLIVGVDAIEAEVLDGAEDRDPITEALFPAGAEYLLLGEDGRIAGGSPQALAEIAPYLTADGLPQLATGETAELELEHGSLALTRLKASPNDAALLLFERHDVAPTGAQPADQQVTSVVAAPYLEPGEAAAADEPLLPMGLPPLPPTDPEAAAEADAWTKREEDRAVDPDRSLSSLFDRLAEDAELYTSLEDLPSPADSENAQATEDFESEAAPEATGDAPEAVGAGVDPAQEPEPSPASEPEVEQQLEPESERYFSAAEELETDAIAQIIAFDEPEALVEPLVVPEEPEQATVASLPTEPIDPSEWDEPPDPLRGVLFRVIGRGFEPLTTEVGEAVFDAELAAAEAAEDLAADAEYLPHDAGTAKPLPDIEAVERVSRYNFDELSRILNDRVGTDDGATRPTPRQTSVALNQPEGQLVSLAGETFILNRLPLGILVFRDQQVLFANRSITEMIGYNSVEELRAAGLASVFPTVGGEQQEAGPVNHLVQRNGTLVPVTARLQSISWQGRPALMLSASTTEVRTGHEAAVRAFAELLAETRQDGFIEANRSGMVTVASVQAHAVLGRSANQLLGKSLSTLVDASEGPALKSFLERPARFAETARPCVALKAVEPNTDMLLFAQGQAGVVTGYFALLRHEEGGVLPASSGPAGDVEPAMLARVSRGVRRPLNTIIGFSDLIRSSAFGSVGNERYLEYARDIKTAGQEIAALVDELDDYTRLKDGRYASRPADLDLGALLDSCIVRVRGQAGGARVLVRSAISDRLPHIRADRASLGQAVLNLLASAIGQTPAGGSVILSAQFGEDGSIAVNVRDSGPVGTDPSERFVVFRDGVNRDGEPLAPVRSSVGLALTRSLLAVNACTLSVDPVGSAGTLFSITIPADLVAQARMSVAD